MCAKLRKIPLGNLPFSGSAMQCFYLLMGLGTINLITMVPELVMSTTTVYFSSVKHLHISTEGEQTTYVNSLLSVLYKSAGIGLGAFLVEV